MFCQNIRYFIVSRNRLRNLSLGVLIPIMPAAVTDKNTAPFTKLLYKLDPFHPTTSSPDLRTWGILPELRSS